MGDTCGRARQWRRRRTRQTRGPAVGSHHRLLVHQQHLTVGHGAVLGVPRDLLVVGVAAGHPRPGRTSRIYGWNTKEERERARERLGRKAGKEPGVFSSFLIKEWHDSYKRSWVPLKAADETFRKTEKLHFWVKGYYYDSYIGKKTKIIVKCSGKSGQQGLCLMAPSSHGENYFPTSVLFSRGESTFFQIRYDMKMKQTAPITIFPPLNHTVGVRWTTDK